MDQNHLSAVPGSGNEDAMGNGSEPPASFAVLLADLDALIAEIEHAPAGGEQLDARIHFGFRVGMERCPDLAETLLREGVSWPTVQAAVEAQIPPFTTSLDARLEGESITFVLRAPKRGKWAAMQRTPHGEEVMAWAATEPLARRLVAIKVWRAEIARAAAEAADNENSRSEEAAGSSDEDRDWKVMF